MTIGRVSATPSQPATPSAFDELFAGAPVMAIFRNMPADTSLALAHQAWDLGIDLVEVPIQTPDAVAVLETVVAAGKERGKAVGAGTVQGRGQVAAAHATGAAFTVAPGLDLDIVAAARDRGLPHLPGVATPTEVQTAVRAGLTWLKAFPAIALGTAWFRAMRGPFPTVRFVATGGMDASNAESFLAAGARVVAVGSALADPDQIPRLASLLQVSHRRAVTD